MKNNLKIINIIPLIIFCLFIYFPGQIIQTIQKGSSPDPNEFTKNTALTTDISKEIHFFIEEEVDETDKILHKRSGTTLLRKKINKTFSSAKYTSNEVSPVIILLQQTNLPPPVLGIT